MNKIIENVSVPAPKRKKVVEQISIPVVPNRKGKNRRKVIRKRKKGKVNRRVSSPIMAGGNKDLGIKIR